MKVVAYVDESGTHDKMGIQKGASEVVIAGLVAWREDWIKFSEEWQSTLNKYSAPYFHFKEWYAANLFLKMSPILKQFCLSPKLRASHQGA